MARTEIMKLSKLKVNPRGKIPLNDAAIICETCGNSFKSKKVCRSRSPRYCSKECYAESLKKYKTCEHCGKIFANWINKHFCSDACFRASRVGKELSEKHRKALSIGRKNSPKCKGPNLYNWKGGAETYKERYKVYNNNRRARFVNGGELDKEFLKYLWESHNGKCFYCECDITKNKCLEHLTPLNNGGNNKIYNLVFSCRSCNSRKRWNTLEDYAIKIGKIWLVDKWENVFITAYGRLIENNTK